MHQKYTTAFSSNTNLVFIIALKTAEFSKNVSCIFQIIFQNFGARIVTLYWFFVSVVKNLEVLQVSLKLFYGQGLLRTQKVEIFDLPTCEYVAVHFDIYPPSEKRKIKYTTTFYLYLNEVRLIKKTGLEHSNPC